ncbi:MAG TPA: methyltransferase domain-containing protein [Nitrospira sp.]|nr:methyltransferase domain-containing protein [Nitrospira sp.]
MTYQTDFRYTDRKTKARYVWLKYQAILRGRVLDVGADACHLKPHLAPETDYYGIGFGEGVDRVVDLERELIPFPGGSFDCVLCLDVLEHIENIHAVFDEVCRVTRRFAVVSLPNAWLDFYNMLRHGEYRPGQPMKFYGLPLEPPADRHKWFFSADEAKAFIAYRASKNNMRILQMDHEAWGIEGHGWRGILRTWARQILLRPSLQLDNLYAGTLWVVLEKEPHG